MIGLTSVTFRNLEIEEIIELCKKAQLECIEWGADIHIKPNDFETAKCVKEKMKNENLKVNSYGSYFKVGENSIEEFKAVLETAVVLGAPIIRVWCGNKGSVETTEQEFKIYVEELKKMCRLAKEKNITIACEYHKGTYNDSAHSALKLINEISEINYKTYWQTIDYDEKDLLALKLLKKHIVVAHIFTWDENYTRFDLSHNADMWKKYISEIKNEPISLIMEFVKDDSKKQFLKDAKFLKEIAE